VLHPILLLVLSQKNETSREMRWQQKNNKNPRKIMAYIASPQGANLFPTLVEDAL